MKTAYITLYGSKYKIKTRISENFVQQLNKKDNFVQILKRGNKCIIPKDKIIEINYVKETGKVAKTKKSPKL